MPPHYHPRFLCGAHTLSQAPPDTGLEVAFAGRSNAGKSSAINAIVGVRALARVSKTPGRTQQINFFELDGERRLVDLPGYGYAQIPEKMKRHLHKTLGDYLQTRTSLRGLMMIMDSRHPLMPADIRLLDWCHAVTMPVHILLSKADKLSRSSTILTLTKLRKSLKEQYLRQDEMEGPELPSVQLFSCLQALGLEEARNKLCTWLNL